MMRSFGDRATFAVEVGDAEPYALRTVDVWAAGKRLTVNDNRAFVPVFTRALRSSAVQVRQRDVARCPFPDRTPEEIFRTLRADDLVIVFAFWRDDHPSPEDLGKVFVTRIPADEFAAIAEEALTCCTPSPSDSRALVSPVRPRTGRGRAVRAREPGADRAAEPTR